MRSNILGIKFSDMDRGVKPILLRSVSIMLALMLLSGCSLVGPDYVKPIAPTQKEWIEKDEPKVKTEDIDYSKWWTVFDDPVLNTLVEAAYNQNLNLQIAGLRILQARAQLAIEPLFFNMLQACSPVSCTYKTIQNHTACQIHH